MRKHEQLSLFDGQRGNPTWDDVQKGLAEWVGHETYSTPCREGCMWSADTFELLGERACCLFRKPMRDGMCPSTGRIEWKW